MEMAKYRHVHISFWQDPRVLEEMTPEDKYFYLYLLTNPSTTQIGVYQITKKQMSFDLGYSIESISSLMERFVNFHKLIKYNEKTRELAIINWGKYNLNKAGKPVLDCIEKELRQVKDKTLLWEIMNNIPSDTVSSMFSRYVHDTSNDTYHDTSTRGGQKEKEKEKEKENNTSCRKSKIYDTESVYYQLALRFVNRIKENSPFFKEPNLQKWADDIRLMLERDKRTEEQVAYLIDWCQQDSFWKSNILSPAKLRKQFDQLVIKIRSDKSKEKSGKTKLITTNRPSHLPMPEASEEMNKKIEEALEDLPY